MKIRLSSKLSKESMVEYAKHILDYEKFRLSLLMFLIGFVIIKITLLFPAIAEGYAVNIFRPVSSGIGRLVALVPFSLSEVLLILLVFLGVCYVIKKILRIIKSKKDRENELFIRLIKNFILNILVICAGVYLVYVLTWGILYNRYTFASTANLDVSPATVTELKALCYDLIIEANNSRESVEEDKNGVMKLEYDVKRMTELSHIGYDKAASRYSTLWGTYGNAKQLIFSKAYAYTQTIGIYSPFLFEPNINSDYIPAALPHLVCHETAHQRGYAREDDANFLGFLACINNYDDYNFQYSGYYVASLYALNSLYKVDQKSYFDLTDQFSDAVMRDLGNNRKYDNAHDGPIATASNSINDSFLKFNNQKEGVQSYGAMTDLLIGWFRNELKIHGN